MWEEVIMEQLSRVRFFNRENEREVAYEEAKKLSSVNILANFQGKLVVKRGRVERSKFISDHQQYFIADYVEVPDTANWGAKTMRLEFCLAFYETTEEIKIISDFPSLILNYEKGRKIYIVGINDGDGEFYYPCPCVIDVQDIGFDNTISSKRGKFVITRRAHLIPELVWKEKSHN